jgi:hypothetical protein
VKRSLWAAALLLSLLLTTGCSTLIPKNVEFGQDKVDKFPTPDEDFRETQRQAADLLSRQLDAIEENLLAEGSSPDEVRPVGEAASLADALSTSLGPPLKTFDLSAVKAWKGPPLLVLSDELERLTAEYIADVGEFAEDNDENAGKKIEGTGWLQIGYFSYIAIIAFLGFCGYIALKVVSTLGAAANPAVGLGLNIAKVPAKIASSALGHVLRGGEQFKNAVTKKANLTSEEVLAMFREHQERAQDEQSKELVKHLTKK